VGGPGGLWQRMRLTVRAGHRMRSQHPPPKFMTCSTKWIVVGAILVAVVYLVVLVSMAFPSSKRGQQLNDAPSRKALPSSALGISGKELPSSASSLSVSSRDRQELPQWLKGRNSKDSSSIVSLSSSHGIGIPNRTTKKKNDNGGGARTTITIGVASTVTGCGDDPFIDGAAVLKYSLDMHSTARYDYRMYILYHPSAAECVAPLSSMGFTLLERPTPVNVEDIGGDGGLRERIVITGCCGEKELIKLEAYTLLDHPIVIHLDLDAIIRKPMDDVIDFMLDPTSYRPGGQNESRRPALPLMWPEKDIPEEVSLMFTKDYNVVAPRRRDKPYQGGFFMIRPSMETYEEFRQIVLEGNYDVKSGWGGKVGPFHGGMTIQGLLPWYYEYLHPGRSVELNRCVYNNMNDKPMHEKEDGKKRCRTNEEHCEDCRYRPVEDIVTFHYTICQKPWSCLPFTSQRPDHALCRTMKQEWFLYRSQLETSWGRAGHGEGTFQSDRYLGYCTAQGAYVPIALPYGPAQASSTA
jgi:hypothetical protein